MRLSSVYLDVCEHVSVLNEGKMGEELKHNSEEHERV